MMVGAGQKGLVPVGCANEIANVRVDDTRIRAIEVGVRGISESGGLRRFARSLRSEVCKVG